MYSLVLKDILIIKRPFLLAFGYSTFLFIAFGMSDKTAAPNIYILAIISLSLIFTQNSCFSDDKNKSQVILNSLPVDRGNIVASKYISSLIFMLFNLLIVSIVGLGFNIAFPDKYVIIGLSQISIAIVTATLGLVIYLPVFFKSGYLGARILNSILFLSAFFVPLTVLNYISENQDKSWVNVVTTFFSTSSPWFLGIMAFIFIAILFITSMGLSVKFYKSREF